MDLLGLWQPRRRRLVGHGPRGGRLALVTLLLLGTAACGGVFGAGVRNEAHPLDLSERCFDNPGGYGCQGSLGDSGSTFFGDGWTVTYRESKINRGPTGESLNPYEVAGHAFFDVTNGTDNTLPLDGYHTSERFDAVLMAGGTAIGYCANDGGQIPRKVGSISPGETLTIAYCFYAAGLEQTFQESLGLRLDAACPGCEVLFAVEDQEIDDDAVADVFSSIEAAATNAGLSPSALGYERWANRWGDPGTERSPSEVDAPPAGERPNAEAESVEPPPRPAPEPDRNMQRVPLPPPPPPTS